MDMKNKTVKSLTFRLAAHPEVIAAANQIAKAQDRTASDAVSRLIIQTAARLERDKNEN